MTKSLENRFKVGDWIKRTKFNPGFEPLTNAKFTIITPENFDRYNNQGNIHGYDLLCLEGDEIKEAQKYLKKVLSLQVGDYVIFNGILGRKEVDEITDIPEIAGNLFDTDTYDVVFVKTVTGEKLNYYDCVHNLVRGPGVNELLKNQIKLYEKKLNTYKLCLKNLE